MYWVYWMQLARDVVHWRTVVYTVMNLRITQNLANLWPAAWLPASQAYIFSKFWVVEQKARLYTATATGLLDKGFGRSDKGKSSCSSWESSPEHRDAMQTDCQQYEPYQVSIASAEPLARGFTGITAPGDRIRFPIHKNLWNRQIIWGKGWHWDTRKWLNKWRLAARLLSTSLGLRHN